MAQPMNYREAWAFLDNLQFFKIKLGLESMTRFLNDVGHPQRNLRCIHVAGTNGKGSVSTTLLTILARAGYKVGLYTSPHLSSVRERFRINDNYISEDDFAALATRIRDVLGDRQITYFEFTTALAMLWFAQEQVDVAILEVGMGGRLDATNVITPLVGVITNVSMDHEAYLGDTLAAVAGEKAGIIKPGVPVISGVAPDESRQVVEQVCAERRAPLFLLTREFTAQPAADGSWSFAGMDGLFSSLAGLRCSLKGGYQVENAALALAVLAILAPDFPVRGEDVREGLLAVRWPGRLEYFCLAAGRKVDCAKPQDPAAPPPIRYLLDGAHNPAGVTSLKDTLGQEFTYKRLILVWACMSDKDMSKTLSTMAPLADTIIFTMPESERSARPEQLAALLPEERRSRVLSSTSVRQALELAGREAGPEDLVCVAGSLYLVGAARRILLGDLVG